MTKIITLYSPVLKGESGMYFVVNGSINRDRDKAVMIASHHFPEAELMRVDEEEVWDDEQ